MQYQYDERKDFVLRRRECSLNTLGLRKFDLLSIFKVTFWVLIKTQKGEIIKLEF